MGSTFLHFLRMLDADWNSSVQDRLDDGLERVIPEPTTYIQKYSVESNLMEPQSCSTINETKYIPRCDSMK